MTIMSISAGVTGQFRIAGSLIGFYILIIGMGWDQVCF